MGRGFGCGWFASGWGGLMMPAMSGEAEQDNGGSALEGWVPELASDAAVLSALEQAFDYRGDVTITCRDGSVVEGYVFDRRRGRGLDDSAVRVMPADGGANRTIAYRQIARLQFADRDPASGKSWENWLRRYARKKARGESASLYGDEDDEGGQR